MAKFRDVQFEALGKFIREMIADKERMRAFKSASQEEKRNILKAFMTPRDVPWEKIKIVAHFDTATTFNISFPFTGDVEQTFATIAPPDDVPVTDNEEYIFPEHYTKNPNAGESLKEKRTNRKIAYLNRLGDYVMARCK